MPAGNVLAKETIDPVLRVQAGGWSVEDYSAMQ